MERTLVRFLTVTLFIYCSLISVSFAQNMQSQEAAKKQLELLNVPYTVDAFISKVKTGDINTINLFLQSGMNVNIRDKEFGSIPLHFAASEGQIDMVNFLVEKGADINNKSMKTGGSPLSQAAVKGHVEIGKILIDHGADVNFKNNMGITPIFVAAGFGKPDFVMLLLNKGADINIKDNRGISAIDAATKNGHHKIVEMLKVASIPLLRKNNITAITNVDTLCQNPFIFKGKKLAINVRLVGMKSETEGFFTNYMDSSAPQIIISGIPTNFPPGEYHYVVCEAVGLYPMKSLMGEKNVPQLKFIDAQKK